MFRLVTVEHAAALFIDIFLAKAGILENIRVQTTTPLTLRWGMFHARIGRQAQTQSIRGTWLSSIL